MKISNPVKYALGIALVGIALTSLISYVEQQIITVNTRNQPYLALGQYLKNASTKAHLWFEEAMAGDESIDVNKDVYGSLEHSIDILQAALQGKETEIGQFYLSDDKNTVAILKESITDVENLKNSAVERWTFKLDAALRNPADSANVDTGEQAGGDLDQKFDASYEELQTTYDRLVNHVAEIVAEDNARLDNLSLASSVAMIVVFGALTFVLFRIQKRNDDFNQVSETKLKDETERLNEYSQFIQAIEDAKYDHALNRQDELSQKLVKMRDTLSLNSVMEKRRSWSSNGMAQIGEILRADYAKVSDLYDKIVKFVVTYTESNQGSLFLLQDDSTHQKVLNLMSAYAFDRKKYQQKSILPGEGLVGQTFLEKSTTLMKVIPKDYVKITSGLGDAPPTALLLVPLKINEVVYGVLELAAFEHYEKYQIELIEKFAESIASTSANVEVNERTRSLLHQTQQQAEELKAAEEEMRQNMEELSATQEEMSRKEREYINRIEELESKLHIALAKRGSSLEMENEAAYKIAV